MRAVAFSSGKTPIVVESPRYTHRENVLVEKIHRPAEDMELKKWDLGLKKLLANHMCCALH